MDFSIQGSLVPRLYIREPGYEAIDKVKLYAMDYDNIRIIIIYKNSDEIVLSITVGSSARTLGVVAGCVGGGLVGILVGILLLVFLIVVLIKVKRRQRTGESLIYVTPWLYS